MIDFLGMTLYPYGLAVAGAAVVALLLAARNFRKARLDMKLLSWFAPLAIALGLIGARAGFCLAAWDYVAQDGLSFVLEFTRGGFMLYGALAGCVIALVIACRLCKACPACAADALAVPGMLMIALCRLAEGLVEQGYGWPIADWFMEDTSMSLFTWADPSVLYRFPFGVADYYGGYKWAVFVFEAIVAVGIAIALTRLTVKRSGGRAVMMVLLYAATQILCESLRQDSVLRWGFVRVNQVVGAVLIAGVLVLCFCLTEKRDWRKFVGSFLLMLLGMGLVMAMEFALEKKISAIEFLPMDMCYLMMGGACALMISCIRPHWQRAFAAKE